MSETVLLVDDDAITSSAVRRLLVARGLRVVERRSGLDALEWLASNTADLILLDVPTSEMSSFEVCRLIRAAESPREVPIVVLAARDRFAVRAQAQAAGVNLCLVKPLPSARLIEVVERLLGLPRSVGAPSMARPQRLPLGN